MAAGWTDLGDGIQVRQSRGYWLNSAVLLDPEVCWVIDPGLYPDELDDLAAVVGRLQPEQVVLGFTHGDWDHVFGRPTWPHARTVAHDRFAAFLRHHERGIRGQQQRLERESGMKWPVAFAPFKPDEAVSGQRFLKTGSWRVVLRDAPGHSDNMLTFHLPDHGVLLGADMLSDIEIPSLHAAPADYRRTLDTLLPIAANGAIHTLVPGHGSIARGSDAVMARFRADLDYLDALERGVREAIADGLSAPETVARLDGMSYVGKGDSAWDTTEFHRENVEQAHRAVSVRPARTPGRAGKPR
jgi:glyoxylase-like metal-dependent hydrolase (beta-lactamase superfamily II)